MDQLSDAQLEWKESYCHARLTVYGVSKYEFSQWNLQVGFDECDLKLSCFADYSMLQLG